MAAFELYEEPHGPQLEVLGKTETALPAPLRKKGTAYGALIMAVILGVAGIGGMKLKQKYTSVENQFYSGKDEDGYSYNISSELQQRLDTASNIALVGGQLLGSDSVYVKNAEAAKDELKQAADRKSISGQYSANSALGQSVSLLYQEIQAADSTETGKLNSLQTQWSEFLSAQDRIEHLANQPVIDGQVAFNDAAQAYNDVAEAFPASLIAGLWGCGSVELFA